MSNIVQLHKEESLPKDLRTAAVMQLSIFDLQEIAQELQHEVALMRQINQANIQVLKAFSDLYLELTEKTVERSFIEKTIKRVEREAARTRLPLWFWRPEPELDIKKQLARRARFLIDELQYCPDDTWDLLKEYITDYARVEVADESLKRMLEYLYSEKGQA